MKDNLFFRNRLAFSVSYVCHTFRNWIPVTHTWCQLCSVLPLRCSRGAVKKTEVMVSLQLTVTVRLWACQDSLQRLLFKLGLSTCPTGKPTIRSTFHSDIFISSTRSARSPLPWPSPCQRSWRRGGSSRRLSHTPREAAAGRRWRWTSTAPTLLRPSLSTTSTRDASSRHMSTCE